MKATIKITSLNTDVTISANDTTNKMIVNGKNIKFNVPEFIGKLAIITSNWAPFYGENSIIDGEEFIVYLEAPTIEDTIATLESLRQVVRSTPFKVDDVSYLHLSISIGAAQLENGVPLKDTIHLADQHLYIAKEKGRDQLIAHFCM